jgi:signal transduction histidine kinase
VNSHSVDLVFFFYGLAFFSMGLSMLLESGRSPLIDEGRALRFLAAFGIVHGFHEWFELYLLNSPDLVIAHSPLFEWIRLSLLMISFTLLVIFSLLSLQPQGMTFQKTLIGLISIFLFFGIILGLDNLLHTHDAKKALEHVDVLARYALGIVGAGLACLALINQASRAASFGRRTLARSLYIAAVGFGLYSLTQLIVSRQDFFPASWLNTTAFLTFTGVPIQAIRAITAILITLSLIWAVQISDEIRKQELLSAQQARLEALRQLQHEMEERGFLRQEVMRHTVIVQEEERTRIARELHDETAQVLTAFKFHLASLERGISPDSFNYPQVGQLKKLCSQMSESLYRMVHDLRPAQLDDLGLVAALEFLVTENQERTGMIVNLVVRGTRRRLDSLVETVVFRVTQEALLNVIRHAGVKSASVDLFYSKQELRLEVSDQGCGFNPAQAFQPPKGFGLVAMRERVEAVGGDFEVMAAPGSGTRIIARIPLQERIFDTLVSSESQEKVLQAIGNSWRHS